MRWELRLQRRKSTPPGTKCGNIDEGRFPPLRGERMEHIHFNIFAAIWNGPTVPKIIDTSPFNPTFGNVPKSESTDGKSDSCPTAGRQSAILPDFLISSRNSYRKRPDSPRVVSGAEGRGFIPIRSGGDTERWWRNFFRSYLTIPEARAILPKVKQILLPTYR